MPTSPASQPASPPKPTDPQGDLRGNAMAAPAASAASADSAGSTAPAAPAGSAAAQILPLAALAPARLAGLQGVLTDIDDTLTRDGQIEPAALQALHALAPAGVPVLAITGRPAGWCQRLARAWPLAAMVAENGGVLLLREAGAGSAWRCRFTVDDATRQARFDRLAGCARAVLAELPGTLLARDSAGRLTDIAVDHSEFTTLDATRIAQVVALMQRHGLQASVSSIHINGWIGEHDKFTGAAWAVQQALGLDFVAQDWLYLGDSANDQVMFARLPLSVAVANILPGLAQLTALPAYLTRAERGQGFAELAAAVLRARTRPEPRALAVSAAASASRARARPG